MNSFKSWTFLRKVWKLGGGHQCFHPLIIQVITSVVEIVVKRLFAAHLEPGGVPVAVQVGGNSRLGNGVKGTDVDRLVLHDSLPIVFNGRAASFKHLRAVFVQFGLAIRLNNWLSCQRVIPHMDPDICMSLDPTFWVFAIFPQDVVEVGGVLGGVSRLGVFGGGESHIRRGRHASIQLYLQIALAIGTKQ